MRDLLEALVKAAEKGSLIARIAQTHCISKSTQEKGAGEANPRFQQDFKTLADVLVQEAVRSDLTREFPSLSGHIFGEETNTFSNLNGDTVRVEVLESAPETARLLVDVVNMSCAQELANAVHHQFSPGLDIDVPNDFPDIDLNDVGIWIDPIDCTSEFINGELKANMGGNLEGIMGRAPIGLPCVTVLIGAFLRSTGEPIIGVINQPFYNETSTRYIWGVSYGDFRLCNTKPSTKLTNTLTISMVETSTCVYRLLSSGYSTLSPPGAGCKLMMTALGLTDGYILSLDTTFKWDTCGPHAILRAMGGDIVSFTPPRAPVLYNEDGLDKEAEGTMKYANRGGIIAYCNPETLDRIKKAFV